VQKTGQVRVFDNTADVSSASTFIDIASKLNSDPSSSNDERGLLGMAFHPNYPTDPRVYLYYTATDPSLGLVDRVSEFRTTDNGATLSTGTELPLFNVDDPESNHNGGNIAFGPDGYLYIGIGDGGGAGDAHGSIGNGQLLTTLLGKMLRIDVSVADTDPMGYRVPADNPFVAGVPVPARPEIWAFGLRNPWRYSFDDPTRGGTGALIIGDVGQNAWEEVNYEPRASGGRNYGWRLREATHDYDRSRPAAYTPLTEPIHEYDHAAGVSITGGFVYRGTALPATFRGRYFFADLLGRVWSLGLSVDAGTGEARKVDVIEHTQELGGAAGLGFISSFGVDADGELFIVGYTTGKIFKIIGPPAAPAVPTGLRIVR